MVNVQYSSDSEDESFSIDAPNYSSLSSGRMAASHSDVSSDESDDETVDPDECEINIISL